MEGSYRNTPYSENVRLDPQACPMMAVFNLARREVFTYLGETSGKGICLQLRYDAPSKSSLPLAGDTHKVVLPVSALPRSEEVD